ncbi:putative serine threonine-protein kinase chk1 [Venturia nashicola]|nr:putative serine threonine-protein kinase chk1 [Venturia nashicola]
MSPLPGTQTAPLPRNLPFKVVSRTIGTGAYAFIRKAIPLNATAPVIAVKFINKDHAFQHGKLRPKQLQMELMLHQYLGKHKNIIELLTHGEDTLYTWIAMELAEGGDLFDKIEADEGVGEDIAHFYFVQLMNAVGYMHAKGVAHRDIKPENLLLSGEGNLKLADFGLAALFMKGGVERLCNTVCGSPPYIAPEIVRGQRTKRVDVLDIGYAPNVSDIWSCGVVLFVLLVGNTPWDEPTARSYEFNEYLQTDGRTGDDLWFKLPSGVLSLLRGMLKLDTSRRFTLDEIRTHPWFTRPNQYLGPKGEAVNPIALATQMMEQMRIDFEPPPASQHTKSMDIDMMDPGFAATQPETPMIELSFDWEPTENLTRSQPTRSHVRAGTQVSSSMMEQLAEDPALSQFTQNPSVPISLTQAAKRFGDIVPSHSLARFVSTLPIALLVPNIVEGLHRLGVPVTPVEREGQVLIRVKTVDGRRQALHGTITVEIFNDELCEVRFNKAKGDPLEWRRFFKKMCAVCKDVIYVPGQY